MRGIGWHLTAIFVLRLFVLTASQCLSLSPQGAGTYSDCAVAPSTTAGQLVMGQHAPIQAFDVRDQVYGLQFIRRGGSALAGTGRLSNLLQKPVDLLSGVLGATGGPINQFTNLLARAPTLTLGSRAGFSEPAAAIAPSNTASASANSPVEVAMASATVAAAPPAEVAAAAAAISVPQTGMQPARMSPNNAVSAPPPTEVAAAAAAISVPQTGMQPARMSPINAVSAPPPTEVAAAAASISVPQISMQPTRTGPANAIAAPPPPEIIVAVAVPSTIESPSVTRSAPVETALLPAVGPSPQEVAGSSAAAFSLATSATVPTPPTQTVASSAAAAEIPGPVASAAFVMAPLATASTASEPTTAIPSVAMSNPQAVMAVIPAEVLAQIVGNSQVSGDEAGISSNLVRSDTTISDVKAVANTAMAVFASDDADRLRALLCAIGGCESTTTSTSTSTTISSTTISTTTTTTNSTTISARTFTTTLTTFSTPSLQPVP